MHEILHALEEGLLARHIVVTALIHELSEELQRGLSAVLLGRRHV
jgi:hypothetical protein